MSSIDERIVEMKFNNAQFESAAKSTFGTLDHLKKALNFDAAKKGFDGLSAGAKSVDMSSLGKGADWAGARLTALSVAGGVMLANLASQAVNAGATIVKALTLDAKTAGFQEYELKLGSIQTILANTQKYGTKLKEVNKTLNQLNEYADKTIYNFGDMTRNIALFTNAGFKIKEATSMIKGFSNEAAASGTNASSAAGAAYQLSQALSAGRVRLQDWRSLTNVGMGNKNMQQGLIEIADAMGLLNEKTGDAKTIAKDFNGSLEKNWLSAQVMSNYLKIMAQDMSVAEMKTLGLSEAQIKMFKNQAKTAFEAATLTRTFTQLWGQMQEAAGSAWGKTFELIIGDFNQATKTLSALNDTLVGFIDGMGDARNKMLAAWAKAGGRTDLIEGLSNIGQTLLGILTAIGEAWQEVFPPMTGKQLASLTKGFREFTENLKMGEADLATLKGSAKAVFTVLKGGVNVVKFIVAGWWLLIQVAGKLIGIMGEAVKPIIAFISGLEGLGDPAKGIDTITDKLMELRENGFRPLLDFLDMVRQALIDFNKSFSAGGGGADSKFGPLIAVGDKIKAAWSAIGGMIKKVWEWAVGAGAAIGDMIGKFASGAPGALDSIWNTIKQIGAGIGKFFSDFGSGSNKLFEGFDINTLLATINTGIFAAIILAFRKFLKTGGSIIESITGVLDDLSGTLQAMQRDLKANALMKIGVAIALLAGSLFILSQINPDRLLSSSIAMGVVFGALLTSVAVLGKVAQADGIVKGPVIAATLIILAGALLIISKAVQQLSGMSWEELAKGLTGMVVILGAMVGVVALLGKNTDGIFKAAAAMVVLAVALRMLVGVVQLFGSMDMNVLWQGGIALGVLLAALVGFALLTQKSAGMMAAAAAMVVLAIGIRMLVSPITDLGLLPLPVLAQGMFVIALAIGALVVAASSAQGSLAGAGAIAILAVALNLLLRPISALGLAPWDVVVRGVAAIAGVLAILVVAANSMLKAIPGAGAIVVLSIALTILSGAIMRLGGMSLAEIGKALFALAGAIAIFGIAAALLTPVIPSMMAMAIAIGVFGLAVMAIGGGLMMISVGLMMLGPAASVGAGGLSLLAVACTSIVGQTPAILAVGAAFIVLSAGVLLLGAGVFGLAVGLMALGVGLTMVAAVGLVGATALLAVVNALKPLLWEIPTMLALGAAFTVLGAGIIAVGAGALILAAGLIALAVGILAVVGPAKLAEMVLTSLMDSIRKLAPVASDLTNLASSSDQYAAALSKLAMGALQSSQSLAATSISLRSVAESTKATSASITQLPGAITTAVNTANTALVRMSSNMATTNSKIGTSVTQMKTKMDTGATGIGTAANKIVQVFEKMATGISSTTGKVISAVSKTFSSLASDLRSRAAVVGNAILNGMVRGMANSSKVSAEARRVARAALNAAKDELGVASPSKEFEKIGKYVNQGFAKGLLGSTSDIDQAFSKMQDVLKNAIEVAKDNVAKQNAKLKKLNKAKKKDKKEIAETKKELAAYKKLQKNATAANAELTKRMKEQQGTLHELSTEMDEVTERLNEANRALDDAIRKRDDAARTWKDKYSQLPEIDEEGSLEKFTLDLQQQVEATKRFMATMAELRKRGLNDTMYKELMDRGPEAQPFLDEVIESGWGGIANLNELSSELNKVSEELGKTAATELYQAGVDIAQGLVDGITAERDKIEAAMKKIADALVKAIKDKLGIKSPSKEFTKIGAFAVDGLAKGLQTATLKVDKAAENLGKSAMDSIRDSIKGISDLALTDADLQPTITPVLDLTKVTREARQLDGILDTSLKLGTSYSRASSLALDERTRRSLIGQLDEDIQNGSGDSFTFNQYNNSPKALSYGEIYRQTRNQLSTAKEALPK